LQTKAKVNVGFWGGITPENAHKHDVLWGMLKAGALGFKSFVSPSGINDFENVSRSDVADAMHFLLSKGAPYFVHAELVTDVEQAEVRATLHTTRAHLGQAGPALGQRVQSQSLAICPQTSHMIPHPSASKHTSLLTCAPLTQPTGCLYNVSHCSLLYAVTLITSEH